MALCEPSQLHFQGLLALVKSCVWWLMPMTPALQSRDRKVRNLRPAWVT